jgi:hypothetical protein
MTSPKTMIVRKAGKATVRHAAHGTVSKARREPMRAATLFGIGGLVGAVSAWIAARRFAPAQTTPPVSPPPTLA